MTAVGFRSDADDAWIEVALTTYSVSRDPTLRDEIAARTAWIAKRNARRFSDCGEPLDDLVQVATIGLLKAIDRFDPGFGVHFGAYATPTIMGELRRHFRDHTWSVHVPRRTKDVRTSVNTANEELTRDLGRPPLVSEIAARANLSVELVLEALEANSAYRTYALDQTDTGGRSFVDSNFDDMLNLEAVASLLHRLAPREQRVLYLRFFEELSQAQIAERIGTSQVHVGRLITSSLATLRVAARHDEAESA